MLSRIGFALAVTTPLLAACTDTSVEDELASDDARAGDAAKGDQAGGTYTYYFVQPDLRKCAAPACGGVFYRLANASTMACFDGTEAESCYAASVDWAKSTLA